MAALSTEIRENVWRALNRTITANKTDCSITKADLLAAVNAADTWVDNNAASFNSALPVAFRTWASVGMKATLLAVVALARYNPALVDRFTGE